MNRANQETVTTFAEVLSTAGTASKVREISFQQMEWLLQGFEIEQKKALRPVKRSSGSTCF